MNEPIPIKRVLLTGSTGLIGSALKERLLGQGVSIVALVRREPAPSQANYSEVRWHDENGLKDFSGDEMSPVDAVVHLAGEPVFGLWTKSKKEKIFRSRVEGTRQLSEYLARQSWKPNTLVCASAIGLYGDRGGEDLTEDSAPGTGFLAETAQKWEQAADAARAAGIRVVHLRIGIVLAKHGSALKMMLPAYRLGLGGKLGTGRQYMSWIALSDLVAIIEFAMTHPVLNGPVNAVSQNPVTNEEFSRTLAEAVDRPAAMPIPIFLLKWFAGEMAQEALLASARVIPGKLQQTSFQFKLPDLESAMKAVLA